MQSTTIKTKEQTKENQLITANFTIYSSFMILLLLLIWYSCTSACNIFSKLFINNIIPVSVLDCSITLLSLSVIQLLSGVMCGAVATGRIVSPFDLLRWDRISQEVMEITPKDFSWITDPTTKPEMIAATCHAVGGFCLNLCYLYSSVFIVQVLKCMEPVATMIMSAILLGEFPSVYLVSSVITIICGVALVCFKDSTISLVPVLIAVSSNFLYPLRNVLGKKAMQVQQEDDEDLDINTNNRRTSEHFGDKSSIDVNSDNLIDKEQIPLLPRESKNNDKKSSLDAVEVFYRVSFLGLYLILPFIICFILLDGLYVLRSFGSKAWSNLVYSGVTHAVYNIASYGVLERMRSPTTHAIANVFKRIFTIGSAVVVFGDSDTKLTIVSYIGLVIASIGLVWYQFESTKN